MLPSGSSHSLLKRTTVFAGIENPEDLRLVRFGVRGDFLGRQRRPGLRSTGRIANQRRERADDVDHGVTEVLKVLHLPNEHGVAEMEVGRGRIESDFHDQRFAARFRPFELGFQFVGP